jgi:hypothetical protein
VPPGFACPPAVVAAAGFAAGAGGAVVAAAAGAAVAAAAGADWAGAAPVEAGAVVAPAAGFDSAGLAGAACPDEAGVGPAGAIGAQAASNDAAADRPIARTKRRLVRCGIETSLIIGDPSRALRGPAPYACCDESGNGIRTPALDPAAACSAVRWR